ncbi:DUF2806 domain-containing protein [Methylomagnum sp.]
MSEAANIPADAVARLRQIVAVAVGPETVGAATSTESEAGDIVTRLQARVSHRDIHRQRHIERIIALTLDNAEQSDAKAPVDSGWLTRFFECAQDASHETEQQVWARMLAREVANPGSVSKRALVFLSAMEAWELDGFIEYAAFAFAFESGWRFMFAEEIAFRELWTYGRELDLTQHFISIGLLSGEVGTIKPGAGRWMRINYRDRVYELRGGEAWRGDSDKPGLAYRKFTPVGQQLAEAIRPKSFFGYARNLVKALNSAHGTGFELIEPPPEKL